MENNLTNCGNHERVIAGLLRRGTWLASAIIASGLAVEVLHRLPEPILHGLDGVREVEAGVVLFILLPVLRVAVMLILFLIDCDYAYVAISALVLAIIGVGFLAGL